MRDFLYPIIFPLMGGFGLLIAALLPIAGQAGEPLARSISVSGEGRVSVAPDRAQLRVAVDALDLDLKLAEKQVNAVVRRYLDAVRALGIEAKDINTAGIQVQPEFRWDPKNNQQILEGYRVRREIRITVRDLDKLGDFLMRATDAGVTQVNPPVFESSRAEALEREALAKAALDAQAKARVLAETLGVKLGPPRTIQAQSHDSLPKPLPMTAKVMMAADAAESAAETMGLSVGEIELRAALGVEFEIIPQ